MNRTSRVLVIRSSKTEASKNLKDDKITKLERFGIVTLFAQPGRQESIEVVDALPDLILLDAMEQPRISKIRAIADKLKENSLSKLIPICVITDPSDYDKFSVDAHFDARLPANILARKIKQTIRLASMGIEYSRRLATARTFGLDAPEIEQIEDTTPTTMRLLFLGKGERYFTLASVFGGSAVLKSCKHFLDAVVLLKEDAYDCLVVDTLTFPDFNWLELETLKSNTRFFNLPVLLLQEGLDENQQADFIEGGLCDLFDLNFDAPEIATHVRTVVRSEYLRRSLQAAFTSPKLHEITDVFTGLPSGAFFEKHLERLTQESKAWNLPIAFGLIKVVAPDVVEGASSKSSEEHIIGQVGRMIASLIRTNDVATYFGQGQFIIAAPNNTANAISVLMSRIAAIIEMTELAMEGTPCRIEAKTDYFISEASNTLDEVMTRIRKA